LIKNVKKNCTEVCENPDDVCPDGKNCVEVITCPKGEKCITTPEPCP